LETRKLVERAKGILQRDWVSARKKHTRRSAGKASRGAIDERAAESIILSDELETPL